MVVWSIILALSGAATAQTVAQPRMFRIGAPTVDSPTFAVAALVASGLSNPPGGRPCERGGSCGVPGMLAAAQALTGVADALDQVTRRQIDGVVLSAADAVRSYEASAGAQAALRTVGTLFVEELHLLVPASSQATRLGDLTDGEIAVGLAQGQPSSLLREMATALGFQTDLIRFVESDDAVATVADGRLPAALVLATWPQPWPGLVEGRLKLVPLSAAEAAKLIADRLYLVPRQLPVTLVEGGAMATTVGVPTQLFVPADSDLDLVFQITRSLWHPATLRLMFTGSAEARDARPQQALAGVRVPVHLGAQRWYRDAGLLASPAP
ncbi:MAG: TAXI family TRAP transporter solute-binding subunit [Alphaproteobacteria bacterium]|nr:TAXI family TRAP transporter solute-binding subunit [Alphaproteobacteria bacterium]